MKRRTFDVLFKRDDIENVLGNHFSVRAVDGILSQNDVTWRNCPRIDKCRVADFLEQFFGKNGDVQEFKMTLTKKG